MRKWNVSEEYDVPALYVSNNLVTHVLVKAFYIKIDKDQLNGSLNEHKVTIVDKRERKLI